MRSFRLLIVVLVAAALVTVPALAQRSSTEPTGTQCKVWDAAYLAVFNSSLLTALAVAVLLPFLLALLGRRSWFMTRHAARAGLAAGVAFVLAAGLVVAWPVTLGFGSFPLAEIPAAYRQCHSLQHSRPDFAGLFGGLVGQGTPAFASRGVMVLSFAMAGLFGLAVSCVLNATMARVIGVAAQSKRGAE